VTLVLADYFHVEQIKKTNFAPQNHVVGGLDNLQQQRKDMTA